MERRRPPSAGRPSAEGEELTSRRLIRARGAGPPPLGSGRRARRLGSGRRARRLVPARLVRCGAVRGLSSLSNRDLTVAGHSCNNRNSPAEMVDRRIRHQEVWTWRTSEQSYRRATRRRPAATRVVGTAGPEVAAAAGAGVPAAAPAVAGTARAASCAPGTTRNHDVATAAPRERGRSRCVTALRTTPRVAGCATRCALRHALRAAPRVAGDAAAPRATPPRRGRCTALRTTPR